MVEAVSRASPFVRAYFVEAHPVSFVKNLLVIGFDPEFADHLPLVDNSKNHQLVQTKLAELGHPNAQVKFIKSEAPERPTAAQAPATPPSPVPALVASSIAPAKTPAKPSPPTEPSAKPGPAPFNKEEFKNDPLIKKALEVFKGQIVDVRS